MNNPIEKVRVDKWLWGIRLFKTRSLAAEACEKGRITINEIKIKAGRGLKIGEKLIIHRGPWHQEVEVLQLTQSRMSASKVIDFCKDITPSSELEKLKLHQAALASWNITAVAGRPTKKDRRDMSEFLDDW